MQFRLVATKTPFGQRERERYGLGGPDVSEYDWLMPMEWVVYSTSYNKLVGELQPQFLFSIFLYFSYLIMQQNKSPSTYLVPSLP